MSTVDEEIFLAENRPQAGETGAGLKRAIEDGKESNSYMWHANHGWSKLQLINNKCSISENSFL